MLETVGHNAGSFLMLGKDADVEFLMVILMLGDAEAHTDVLSRPPLTARGLRPTPPCL